MSPYGLKKVTSPEVLDFITDSIRAELLRNPAFSNNSLGYFGVSFDAKITVTLQARGETQVEATVARKEETVEGTKPVTVEAHVTKAAGKKK